MQIKKIFSLLLLAVSTTAQKCSFFESSIGNNYSTSKDKRQKQNLDDIIHIRSLNIIKESNEDQMPSENEIKNFLKSEYPALNTDDIEVSVRMRSYYNYYNYYNDYAINRMGYSRYNHYTYMVKISSTYSGNYTGDIALTCTIRQKKEKDKRKHQNLMDIITIKDLGIVKTDPYGAPSSEDIKAILKKQYPTLNTDHITVSVHNSVDNKFFNTHHSNPFVSIDSSWHGNYIGTITLTYTTKQNLRDIITIKDLGMVKTDPYGAPSPEDIKAILKIKYPKLNTEDIEVQLFLNYNYYSIVWISSTSSGNYTGDILLTYTTKQKQNNWDSYSDYANKKEELNNAYKTLGLPKSSSLEDVKKAYRKLSFQWHPDRYNNRNDNATEEEKKDAVEKFKAIMNAYTLINNHLEKCKKQQ